MWCKNQNFISNTPSRGERPAACTSNTLTTEGRCRLRQERQDREERRVYTCTSEYLW